MEVDEEVDRVAMGAAGEAVIEALPGHDVHRGLRVLVERAQPHELVTLGVESYLLRHQRHDVRGIEDAVSVVGSGVGGHVRRRSWRREAVEATGEGGGRRTTTGHEDVTPRVAGGNEIDVQTKRLRDPQRIDGRHE
jgi:hypothetical protein